MSYPREVLQWIEAVSTNLPHLSKTQARGLALYSFAVTITQACGVSSVAYFLARVLGKNENSLRQQLREALYDAQDKRGQRRRELDVVMSFAPLLGWVLRLWQSERLQIALALDATTLRQTFTVLSISVVVNRCALPVAWTVLPATNPGAWKPHWIALLEMLKGSLPHDYCVLVLADRGLYAKWLFEQIVACGWHPLLRIQGQSSVRVVATRRRQGVASLVRPGQQWQGEVVCFQAENQIRCTLLALWADGYEEAWFLLTDLPPHRVRASWYALRTWIEVGFKAVKRAGFHWERTRMTDPARAERLWLVLALALLRSIAVASALQSLPALVLPPGCPSSAHSYPRLSVFRRGLLTGLAGLLRRTPPPAFALCAEPFPSAPCLEYAFP